VKSHGCQGGGTLRTTATRGWRREGCTGGSELLFVVAAAVLGVGVEEVVARGCGGSGRWPVEEPRRRGEGLAITRSVRPSEARCFLGKQFVESRFSRENVLVEQKFEKVAVGVKQRGGNSEKKMMVMASKEEPPLALHAPSPNRGCGESWHGLCIRRLPSGHTRVMNVART
jgi:hypothetical protein